MVNFVEMLMLSYKTLGASAEALDIEEEESKFEKWLKEKLGVKTTDFIMGVALILGLILSAGLFIALPIGVVALVEWLFGLGGIAIPGAVSSILEGVTKVGIFLGYLALVSLMPDIKRTFMYHGAEHKSIACFEAGDELTPENAMKHTRFHPRCGTSFMFLMILIGILAGFFIKLIPGLETWAYMLIRIAILPLLMGIGYEIIMIAGKHDNKLTRVISAPGIWAQRITTKEPTLDMLECAITSIKCALRDEFPEFMEFYNQRQWEKKDESDPLLECDTCEFSEIAEGIESDGGEAEPESESSSSEPMTDAPSSLEEEA